MNKSLSQLFVRNLNSLKEELNAFKNQDNLWKVPEGVINSCGNLALHLVGNLNHFIGSILGDTGYERDRPAEFNTKDIPVDQLLGQIEQTSNMIQKVLEVLSPEDLQKQFPIEVFGYPMSTEYFLIHLLGHLEYHRGQLNYARRILEA